MKKAGNTGPGCATRAPGREAVDYPRQGIWRHIEVGTTEGIFDRRNAFWDLPWTGSLHSQVNKVT